MDYCNALSEVLTFYAQPIDIYSLLELDIKDLHKYMTKKRSFSRVQKERISQLLLLAIGLTNQWGTVSASQEWLHQPNEFLMGGQGEDQIPWHLIQEGKFAEVYHCLGIYKHK